jgi:serine/threonine protein kinase
LKVCDLGSRNGTLLDNKMLGPHQPCTACPEDLLQVGAHTFRIELFGLSKKVTCEIERTQQLARPMFPAKEFKVLGELGRGATGVVYGAYQKILTRKVAIKVPRTDVEDPEDCQRRFIREGQLCSKINSPYVVTIYEMKPRGKHVYIVMELVNGGSVRDRIKSSVIPVSEAAKIGEDIACALAAIHRIGIIHRDLKPANVLLSPEGIAKLTDFGIAKQLGDEGAGEKMTPSGEGLGTLGYASPEAILCEDLGFASDIYSLGATLYHMLTGRALFMSPHASMAQIMERVLSEDPVPIQELRPDCPPALANLVHQMLSKVSDERPLDAISIAVRLEKIRAKHGTDYVPELKRTDAFCRELPTDSLV